MSPTTRSAETLTTRPSNETGDPDETLDTPEATATEGAADRPHALADLAELPDEEPTIEALEAR